MSDKTNIALYEAIEIDRIPTEVIERSVLHWWNRIESGTFGNLEFCYQMVTYYLLILEERNA